MGSEATPPPSGLARRLGLVLFTLYGLGNILGAGIYVLVGKVAGAAGTWAPAAFLLAAGVAACAAAVYAELSSRYPVSAGEAVFAQEGLGVRWLSTAVGLLVAAAGMLSCAALSRGAAAYLQVFTDAPAPLLMLLLLVALTALACWGILESVRVAALFTLVEVAGLVLVVTTAGIDAHELGRHLPGMHEMREPAAINALLAGAFLAFFAYLGFEDMVNVAEEVRDPGRTIVRGIAAALAISTIIYLLVLLACLNVMEPAELAASDAPLALVYERASGREPVLIGAIGVFAVLNGLLVQLIMASRILYGMAGRGWLPGVLAKVNSRSRTPVAATVTAAACIASLALAFPLVDLAAGTSLMVLGVLIVMCLSLIRIRRRDAGAFRGWRAPAWVPWAGLLTAFGLLISGLLGSGLTG